jgi:hypothetical protein
VSAAQTEDDALGTVSGFRSLKEAKREVSPGPIRRYVLPWAKVEKNSAD